VSPLPETDALITRETGVPICVMTADCVPILLYDPVQHAVGLAHAGWRGTVARIASTTVAAMRSAFDSVPEDLVATIGPSIGPNEFEVGDDVVEKVRAANGDAALLLERAQGNPTLDLWHANEIDLWSAGVEPVELVQRSTSDLDEFFSHRFEPGGTGRFATVAMLRGL